jgi:hypothetical protein
MNKEEILEELKKMILTIRDGGDFSFIKNGQLALNLSIKSLISDDRIWLDREYNKWFEAEIKPFLSHST